MAWLAFGFEMVWGWRFGMAGALNEKKEMRKIAEERRTENIHLLNHILTVGTYSYE